MTSQKEIQIETVTRWDQAVARIALANHMVTREQLAGAFAIVQKEKLSGRKTPIEAVFLNKQMVAEELLNDLCVAAKRKLGKRYGLIALKKEYITQAQLDAALMVQAEEFKKNNACRLIGDILLSQDALTEEQRDEIQSEQEDVEMLERPPSLRAGKKEAASPPEKNSNASDDKIEGEPASASKPEKAASPQEPPLSLWVSENRLEAKIQLKGPPSEDLSPNNIQLDDVKLFLEQEGIKYGLADDEEITGHLGSQAFVNEGATIARGKPMVPAEDATVTYHFDKDYLSAGRIQEDGDIDYRDRGEIPRVQKEDLIAEKTPVKPGEDGIDVYGRPVPASEPEDIKLNCESGTQLSEDGLKVFAKTDGQPNVTVAGKISIFAEFNVPGDVSYETGNIEFDGNINVNGSVNDGFSVTGGNLTAKEILGAHIHVKGDVVVSGGIMGARIEAEGNVIAKYIKGSNIKAYGNVIAAREVLDSKVRVSGKFINQSGKIIASLITATKGVEAKDIGTDVSIPCTIKVGGDDHIRKIVQGFERTASETKQVLEKKQLAYEDLVTTQKAIHKRIADLAQIQDRASAAEQSIKKKIEVLKSRAEEEETARAENMRQELKKKTDADGKKMASYFKAQEALSQKIEGSLTEIEQLIQDIEDLHKQKQAVIDWSQEEKGTPVLQATGAIFSQTRVHGEHSLFHIPETVRSVTIKETRPPDPNSNYEMTLVDE